MTLPQLYVDDIIKCALNEDINYIDVTTDNLIHDNSKSNAVLMSKDTGVLAGVNIFARVFEILDPSINIKILIKDGTLISKGTVLAKLSGDTKVLLKGERVALNILQHLSGIATMTFNCEKLIRGTNTSITDTRKTLPGLRAMQKYAVTVGGGKNHRFNLSDGAMIKDNHIDAYGSLSKAVEALREKIGHMTKIEVEVRNLKELDEALASGVDVVMLDNMDIPTMHRAVEVAAGRVVIEASGNITQDNILDVAKTGVNVISIGALTHSVKAFDISMQIS